MTLYYLHSNYFYIDYINNLHQQLVLIAYPSIYLPYLYHIRCPIISTFISNFCSLLPSYPTSNAITIVNKLPNRNIFFIPDNNLARFVAKQVPDKHFIFNDGFCHVHKSIHSEDVTKAKELHPGALVLAHPECTEDTLELADFIGSTSQIIDYATTSPENVFIICTEMGVFFELMQKNPDKKFYSVGHRQFCPNMKKVRIEKVIEALENIDSDNYNIEYINLDEDLRKAAEKPLSRMLELAK